MRNDLTQVLVDILWETPNNLVTIVIELHDPQEIKTIVLETELFQS